MQLPWSRVLQRREVDVVLDKVRRRLLRVADQLVTWLRYSLVVALDRRRASAKPSRKKWQAEGRIAQLLRLG